MNGAPKPQPDMTDADRELVTQHVQSGAALFDRVLGALRQFDPDAWAAAQRLLTGGGLGTVRVTVGYSGFVHLAVDVRTPRGDVHEILAADLTPPQQPDAAPPLQ